MGTCGAAMLGSPRAFASMETTRCVGEHPPLAAPDQMILNCGKNDSGIPLGLCCAFPDAATSTQWPVLLWCKHCQI